MQTTTRPPRRSDALFPKYAHDYFEQLRQQYMLMLDNTNATSGASVPLKPPPTIEALFETYQADPTNISWADVFTLETAYLFALPDDRVQAEVLLYRSRYSDVAGTDAYASYAKTVPADVTTMTVRQLRAELMTLVERLHYLYTFIPPKEATRNRLATSAGVWTLIAAAVAVALYFLFRTQLHEVVPTILVVFFVGQMGGFLSVQQRLQKLDGGDPLFRELQLSSGWFSIVVVAPIVGSFFAVLLYFLFVAGELKGGFFPEFVLYPPPWKTGDPIPAGAVSVTTFLQNAAPGSMADWGKLLVWAFIAGFAERFVPGVLDRLSGNSDVAAGTPLIANTTNSAVLIPGSALAADAQNAATPPATPAAPDAPPAAQPATTST